MYMQISLSGCTPNLWLEAVMTCPGDVSIMLSLILQQVLSVAESFSLLSNREEEKEPWHLSQLAA